MKIIGASGRFFPKSDINVDICDHRFDALATVSQDTDLVYTPSRYLAELTAFKYNIGISAFINDIMGTDDDIADSEGTGRIRYDIYFQSDYWYNPVTLVYELIPDYYDAVWSATGALYFSGAVEGVAKSTFYPNHGSEMYDISGGDYGYSTALDQAGTSNLVELYTLSDRFTEHYQVILNRRISSMSFRNGASGAAIPLINRILAARNSGYTTSGDSKTDYGRSKNSPFDYLGLPELEVNRFYNSARFSSTRWWDAWNFFGFTKTQANTYSRQEIAKTILNNGWYNDFIHWDDTLTYGTPTALDEFYDLIDDEIGADFVNRMAYGEAVEYMYFRNMIERVSSYESDSRVYIILQKKDNFIGTDTDGIDNDVVLDCINTPLSVKIDLTGTSLAGKNIKSDGVGIKSLGSNQYVIDVSFGNKTEGYIQVVLSEEAGAIDYYNFTKPVISSATVNSEVMTVVTDLPTRCAVFVAERGAAIETAVILERSNTLGTSHSIALTTANQAKDIYIGVITDVKQSILSNVYQFI